MQRGGFGSEQDARESLERALEQVRRANGTGTTLTLTGLVDEYLAQHDAQPETIEKLRWLLSKAVSEFGNQRLGQLRSQEIAAWRMTIPAGASLRGDPGAPPGAEPRSQLENDRRQPSHARC